MTTTLQTTDEILAAWSQSLLNRTNQISRYGTEEEILRNAVKLNHSTYGDAEDDKVFYCYALIDFQDKETYAAEHEVDPTVDWIDEALAEYNDLIAKHDLAFQIQEALRLDDDSELTADTYADIQYEEVSATGDCSLYRVTVKAL